MNVISLTRLLVNQVQSLCFGSLECRTFAELKHFLNVHKQQGDTEAVTHVRSYKFVYYTDVVGL